MSKARKARERTVARPITRIIVPVSGGKDSQVTLSLAVRKYGPAMITGLHNFTGIDHSLTYEHMRWMSEFYGVPIAFTNADSGDARYKDIFDLMERRDMIPGRQARLCTDEFKIQAMNRWLQLQPDRAGMLLLMGMRAQESQNRMDSYGEMSPDEVFSLRDLFPSKTPKYLAAVRVQLPIVNRSTPWVYEYAREHGEKLNPLYARGHKRVGCYPCLLAGKHDFRLAARDPEGRETIIRLDALRDSMFARKGIRPGSKLWEATLHGMDLKKLLSDEDPANPKRDPFGIDDDGEDDGGGCGVCQ